jgi:hypothetical protein
MALVGGLDGEMEAARRGSTTVSLFSNSPASFLAHMFAWLAGGILCGLGFIVYFTSIWSAPAD